MVSEKTQIGAISQRQIDFERTAKVNNPDNPVGTFPANEVATGIKRSLLRAKYIGDSAALIEGQLTYDFQFIYGKEAACARSIYGDQKGLPHPEANQ